MAAPFLDELAERYSTSGVGSIFLYTHEAHPGEHYPHLISMEQKYRHARDLRELLGVKRTIVVDSLDGACHRAFGSMPNMTWIFGRSGVPVYKSNWTDHFSVENAIEYFLQVTDRRSQDERVAPFQVERLDYRNVDREAFYQGLERNGPKAVKEFRAAFG
jgi:hypothetical protein